MLKRLFILSVSAGFILCPGPLFAGNHEVIHPTLGHSIGWENPDAIPYWIDPGPLGGLNNTQARFLMESMMDTWSEVDTARVGFSYQGDLPDDITEENIADYLAMTTCGSSDRQDIPEDVVPIVFDSDGRIIEYLVGLGSAVEVGGLSTLRCFVGTLDNPTGIYQGMIIINGQFYDGKNITEFSPADLTINNLAGVMLHELGHLIGLDHTALNEELYDDIAGGDISEDYSRYLPVMLPTVLRGSVSGTTLRPDDIAALSTLYPADNYLEGVGKIAGEVLAADGEEIRKVNVIARRGDDPLCEAVSAVTGRRCVPLLDSDGSPNFNMTACGTQSLFGDYVIEGLTPGSYTVEVAELARGWIRNGMYPSTVSTDLPGDAEFYNEGDVATESEFKYSLVDVSAGEAAQDINIRLNSTEALDGQLDRISLDQFEDGPATRCRTDPIDYADIVADIEVGADITSPLEDEGADGSGFKSGGCQLNRLTNRDDGIVVVFVFVLFYTIILLRQHTTPLTQVKSWVRRGMWALIAVAIVSSVPAAGYASSIVPPGLGEMSRKAGKIFHGRCIDAIVVSDEHNIVSTVVTYEVLRGVKGVEGPTVTFKVFGVAAKSAYGTQASTIIGLPEFFSGREDVLFLYEESPLGFTAPVGIWQGSFPVVRTGSGPRLLSTGGAYQEAAGISVKAAGGVGSGVVTPDDLLDRVESILATQ